MASSSGSLQAVIAEAKAVKSSRQLIFTSDNFFQSECNYLKEVKKVDFEFI